VKRRDLVVSLAASGLGIALGPWVAAGRPNEELSEEQLRMILRELAGFDLPAAEAPKVLAAFKLNRFTTKVDPIVQPQADFDPEVEP
jgi:hypothetical protein